MKSVLTRLDQWLFGYGSPLTLGVFRGVFSTLIVLSLLLQSRDLYTWFGPDGLSSGANSLMNEDGRFWLNPLAYVQDFSLMMVIYWAIVGAGVLTIIGFRTRLASILFAVGVVALHHRSPFMLNGGDTLLRVVAVYIAIAPSGAAFSLDARMRREQNLPEITEISLWPQRLIQLQIAILYLTTVLIKLQGVSWRNGTASWYTSQLTAFKKFPVPAFVDSAPMVRLTTYGALVIELALATLVFWKPARKWVLMGGILLHVGIEYRMNIPLFAFVTTSCYICHYSSEEVKTFLTSIQSKWRKQKVHA